jgi:hypothetical protein
MRVLPVTVALVLALVAATQPALAKGKKGRKKPPAPAATTTDEAAAPAEPAAAPPPASEPPPSAQPEPAQGPTPEKAAAETPAAEKSGAHEEATAQAASPASPPDEASRKPRGHVETELFELGAGIEVTGRKFNYNDGISPNLRSYQLFPGPAINVSGQLYPFADSKGILSDVGLAGSFSQIMLVQSSVGSTSLQTSGTSYWGGLRVRIHPGRLLLGASLSYASTAFSFSSTDTTTTATLPAETYRSVRPGLDLRVPLGPISIIADVAFRAVVGSDGLSARFRSPSVNGVEGEAGAVLAIADGIEARLVGRYERYFYSFKPAVLDVYVAGGALDEFFGARLSVAYLY